MCLKVHSHKTYALSLEKTYQECFSVRYRVWDECLLQMPLPLTTDYMKWTEWVCQAPWRRTFPEHFIFHPLHSLPSPSMTNIAVKTYLTCFENVVILQYCAVTCFPAVFV